MAVQELIQSATRLQDLRGQRFGKLVVLERCLDSMRQTTLWRCACDCGNFTVTRALRLKKGHTRSCGCLRRRRWEPIFLENGTVGIPLQKGKLAVIDETDLEKVLPFTWTATPNKCGTDYAATTMKAQGIDKPVTMHRLLMGEPQGLFVDHINGCGLDNRRSNLRLCTNQQNQWNQKKSRGKSKYKGVGWDKKRGRWKAQICLGSFANEEDAARAYDRAAKLLQGEFVRLNFPDES